MTNEQKRRMVRAILTCYYNIKGFLFYTMYLWHSKYNYCVFYSPTMHKYYKHIKKLTFMSDYSSSGIGFLSFTSRVITLTYKDLGMYNLELKKE
jgi:hypothetical protein